MFRAQTQHTNSELPAFSLTSLKSFVVGVLLCDEGVRLGLKPNTPAIFRTRLLVTSEFPNLKIGNLCAAKQLVAFANLKRSMNSTETSRLDITSVIRHPTDVAWDSPIIVTVAKIRQCRQQSQTVAAGGASLLMAANFWQSSHSKQLLDPGAVARLLHAEDDRMGLSPSDVRLVKLHMCDHLAVLAHRLNLRQRVVATAIAYFRRVYVKKSFAEVDPRLAAPAALYVAAKAEECTVQAVKLVHRMKSHACMCGHGAMGYEVKDILAMEMRLLQALSFNLIVFHPYRPLTTYLEDVSRALNLSANVKEDFAQMAWSMLNDSFKTDLSLCHPPFIIALACIHLVALMRHLPLLPWLEGLRVDMHRVRAVSTALLDLYEEFSSLTEDQISAAVGKLPMRLP
ncbi:unnamed protein product [Closterium sp. Yama58-4]|nr:unnamed protein product [Closterium sp. Yama58-4]